ncbi:MULTISPECIES: hypothetical protein [unclassified Streptomyces]|uniref:hypothetical protein n=1 Tax=Streptomyces sp. NPDC058812 TaxID=3346639 RepID=UPI0036B0A30B
MARPEKQIDHTIPELASLAIFLRNERAKANRRYAVLAQGAEVSAATLKRAAAGASLPAWRTVYEYLRACYNLQAQEPVYVRVDGATFFTDFYPASFTEAVSTASRLWHCAWGAVKEAQEARPCPMPTCRFVFDEADLVARLRELHRWARSPSVHVMEKRAGEYGMLPHSTAHRILQGKTIPGHVLQLEAFLRACELPQSQWPAWVAALSQVQDVRLVDTVGNKMHFILDLMLEDRLREKNELAA